MPPSEIQVVLPDGSKKTLPAGATGADLAKAIGPGLAKAALAIRVNGEVRDLQRPLPDGVKVSILTDKDPQALDVLRHSSAHVLATAVRQLFPKAQIGFGPPIEDGFYYDFDIGRPFTPEDLEAIEKKMAEVTKQDYPSIPTVRSSTCVAVRMCRARAGSNISSCCTPRARIGAAMSGGRCCSASTARRGSARTISRPTSGGSKKRANAIIASSGSSSTSIRSKKTSGRG